MNNNNNKIIKQQDKEDYDYMMDVMYRICIEQDMHRRFSIMREMSPKGLKELQENLK